MMNHTELFHVESSGWIKPIIVGISVYAIHLILKWNVYYLHYYFVLAGIITHFLTRRKFIGLNNNELLIYYGLPFAEKYIALKWEQIASVGLHKSIEKTFVAAEIISLPVEYSRMSLLISLNTLNAGDTMELLKKYSGRWLVDKDGDGVILLNHPKGGFKSLLKSISKYTKVKSFESKSQLNTFEALSMDFFVSFALVGVVILVLWLINAFIS